MFQLFKDHNVGMSQSLTGTLYRTIKNGSCYSFEILENKVAEGVCDSCDLQNKIVQDLLQAGGVKSSPESLGRQIIESLKWVKSDA